MKRFRREDVGAVALVVMVVALLLLQMVWTASMPALDAKMLNQATSTATVTSTPTATYTPAPIKGNIGGVTGLTGLALIPGPVFVMSQDATIPAVYSNQRLQIPAAITLTTSKIQTAGVPTGQMLWLTNISTQTLVITDTGTTMLSGNITLGQYDTLLLRFDGTNWLQVSTSNN